MLNAYNGRNRRGGYGRALVRGAVNAAVNRKSIIKVGEEVKKFFKKRQPAQSKSFATGASASYAGGNDFTSSKRTVNASGKKRVPKMSSPKMMYQMLQTTMPKSIFRFNNLSNYDTNVGAIYLGNHRNTLSGEVTLPLHIYDLTSFPNQAVGAPVAGQSFRWASVAAGAACFRAPITGTSAGTGTTQGWEDELQITTSPVVQQAFHQWTDVRFNFFGARKRTTWFEVMFIRVHDELAHPYAAADTNVEYLKLMQYLERPLIWSNLQTDAAGSAHTKFRVVKRMKYFVSAGQTTDVDTSVGNIKEAKIFLKHNKRLDYDWSNSGPTALLGHTEADGTDFVRDSSTHNFPKHKERLLMVVRAFAPERVLTATTPVTNALVDPSYDIIIRNAFTMPPKHSN